jgi:hypothetical protein
MTSRNRYSSVENNEGKSIKGGPIWICSVGVKSACNGPEFDFQMMKTYHIASIL